MKSSEYIEKPHICRWHMAMTDVRFTMGINRYKINSRVKTKRLKNGTKSCCEKPRPDGARYLENARD